MDNNENNNSNIFNQSKSNPKSKNLILKKININNYPELKNKLERYFGQPNEYFNNYYENKEIIMGKRIKKKKLSIKNSTNLLRLGIKKKTRMIITNYEDSFISERRGKKFNETQNKDIKEQKRYVDDKEIDEIFNNFKKNDLTRQKTYNNISNLLENKIEKKIIKTDTNKQIENSPNKSNNNKFFENNFLLTNYDNIYKLKYGNIFKSPKKKASFKKTHSFLLNDKNYINIIPKKYLKNKRIPSSLLKTDKNLLKLNRNEILSLQNQYLTSIKNNESQKNQFKNILTSQELTFLFQKDKENKFGILSDYISQIVKRPSNELLINNTDGFRINRDIEKNVKNQLNNYFREKTFSWENQLRTSVKSKKEIIKLEKNIYNNTEIVRDPKSHMNYTADEKTWKKIENTKINYLKQRMPKKNISDLYNDLNVVFKDYKDLSINGRNLYKFEYDLCKNIKGRKIIYDNIMYEDEKNEKIFAKNLSYDRLLIGKKFKKN